MARRKRRKRIQAKDFFELAREIRVKLREMDQKLEHLIQSQRKFYFTSDFSHSNNRELHH